MSSIDLTSTHRAHTRRAARVLASLLLPLLAATGAGAVVIDFEALEAGHILQSTDWPAGTTLTVENASSGQPDRAIVYDTACTVGQCTGDDDDLRTPGVGLGNDTPRGKIMIIAEDVVDTSPADGLVDDPDDDVNGGVITLSFAEPYKLLAIHGIVDFQSGEEPSQVEIDPAGGGATQIHIIPTLGDNSASSIELPEPVAADEIRFVFGGSGGLDEIELVAACGDGIVDPGEQCDPPNGTTCDATCNPPSGPFCGDGVVDLGEECDDGAANSDTDPDACRSGCTLPVCGDDVIDSGELCDPPDGVICGTACELLSCGDGVVDIGEECDDGAANSDTDPDACRTDCTLPICGDGVIDAAEMCDPPDAIGCDAECMSTSCGNGILDPGEECDPPDNLVCDAMCALRCGNGLIDPGEICDPGDGEICDNLIDDDGDGQIDCHDDDCALATLPTCNELCEPVGLCAPLKRDPATIKLKGGGLDRFKIHARVDANLGDFDPNEVGFGIAIYNDAGLIHRAFVPPGAFTPRGSRNGLPTRYRFKDRSARSLGEDSLAQGIFRANMRFRTVCREPAYTAQIELYGDLSAADSARMTTQYYNVNDLGSLTSEWIRKPKDTSKPLRGWKMTLSALPVSSDPDGRCR